MKIAFVRRKYNPFGGAERFLEQLTHCLLRQGHEIHVYAQEWKPIQNSRFIFHPVPVAQGTPSVQALSFASSAEQSLREDSFDLIYSFERCPFLDFYRAGDGCHLAWLHHQAASEEHFECLMQDPYHQSLISLERGILTGARTRLIVCNSRMVKKEIQKYYGVPDEKLVVLYNGVDLEHFHPSLQKKYRSSIRSKYGISSDALVLLFVGSGFERKGLLFAIRSVEKLRAKLNRPVKLIVVGQGTVETYQAAAAWLGLSEEIIFVGPVQDSRPWYGAADLFVLPTRYDPSSNATLEALASGLPVITTRLNGASELMERKNCGRILDNAFDEDEFVSAVLELSPESVRRSVALSAREAVVPHSIDVYANETLSLYHRMASCVP